MSTAAVVDTIRERGKATLLHTLGYINVTVTQCFGSNLGYVVLSSKSNVFMPLVKVTVFT